MTAPALSWDDFWASYSQSSVEAKQEMLDQIDLKHLIPRLSAKEATKVLQCAPVEIQKLYQRIIEKPVPVRAQRRISSKQLSRFVAR